MRMLRVVGVLVLALGALVTASFAAGPEAAATEKQKPKFRTGGDFRLRQEIFDDIPIKSGGYTRGGQNDYFRLRTRLWAEWDPIENVTLRIRAVNEIRDWEKPANFRAKNPETSTYEWPDEVVFDNLYLEARDLFHGKMDLRIGRQEMIYGKGMLILEGTPKDGSRTIYFNAVKATWKDIKDTTVDLFGIYNPPEDQWAINPADRDLTGLYKGNPDMVESGGGLYVKNKSIKSLPWEAYYIFKNEGAWTKGSGTNAVHIDDADIHTAGFRLMPQFGKSLSGNLEAAYQLGKRGNVDLEGYGVDASLAYILPFMDDQKPTIDAGVYYLSGDDPTTKDKDEGWNPLWARYPQSSELYVYAWDADAPGRWSNLMMPHVGVTVTPAKWVKLTGAIAELYAVENDGPGDGKDRGLLMQARAEFTFGEKIWTAKDKLSGHLWLDVLEPGNYYKVDDTAVFARWQLAYEF